MCGGEIFLEKRKGLRESNGVAFPIPRKVVEFEAKHLEETQ